MYPIVTVVSKRLTRLTQRAVAIRALMATARRVGVNQSLRKRDSALHITRCCRTVAATGTASLIPAPSSDSRRIRLESHDRFEDEDDDENEDDFGCLNLRQLRSRRLNWVVPGS